MKDDVFDGDVEFRLGRAAARVRRAALDAQARDWVAERPDRVGFARLALAHSEITRAAARYGKPLRADWPVQFAGFLALIGTTLTILLVADHPAALPVLVSAIAAGPLACQAVVSGAAFAQRVRARRAAAEAAAIDDPYFHADLTRRLEACAAAARADPSAGKREAADEIGRALEWLSAAADVENSRPAPIEG